MSLTHFDQKGDAHMVDVSDKAVTSRIATAEGHVTMAQETFEVISEGRAKKGDVLSVARLAGIMGAKKTPELIPLCHPLPVTKVAVELTLDPDLPGVRISATVKITALRRPSLSAMAPKNNPLTTLPISAPASTWPTCSAFSPWASSQRGQKGRMIPPVMK